MAHSPLVIDGVETDWPSVTEALNIISKPFLYTWYGKWGNKHCTQKFKRSGKIGTEFHTLAEGTVNGISYAPTTRRLQSMAASFADWAYGAEFVPEVQEFKVISRQYRYHGTLDAVGTRHGSNLLELFDWKSSSDIYKENGYQLAAYAQAYYETTGIRLKSGGIVHVSKDRTILEDGTALHLVQTKYFDLTDPRYFRCFEAALTLYNDSKFKE